MTGDESGGARMVGGFGGHGEVAGRKRKTVLYWRRVLGMVNPCDRWKSLSRKQI